MKRHLKEFVKDDPQIARQHIEMPVENGEMPRVVGEELLRLRYLERSKDEVVADDVCGASCVQDGM